MSGRSATVRGRALVVEDGSGAYVLPAVRSLARAGWEVGVGSPGPHPRAERSRWLSHEHRVTAAEDDVDAFVADVNAAVASAGYDLVFGGDDVEVLALSACRDAIRATVPHAPHDAVLRSVDKLGLTEAAREVGIAVPRTEPATAEALRHFPEPLVVKSRLHWTPGSTGGERHLLIAFCPDRAAAAARVAEVEAAGGAALLQEPLHGEQVAMSAVVDRDGRLAAVSQQRTILQSRRLTSVRAETTAVDRELAEQVRRLLAALGWFGLANLQFLVRDGRPHLIDLNGRFYGSLALAVAAGADLPAVWAELACGRPVDGCQQARAGVRFHSFEEDLFRARAERRGGLVRDLGSCLAYAPGAAHSTWRLDDPMPALGRAGTLATRGVRRALRRR